MTYIARTTPDGPLHLSPAGDRHTECDNTRMDPTTVPNNITPTDVLCPNCFTPQVLTWAGRSNNARNWLGTDGTRVDRLLRQARTLITAPPVPSRWATFDVAEVMADLAAIRRPVTGATLSLMEF